MSEMVELVAWAILRRSHAEATGGAVLDDSDPEWKDYIPEARAAIEAMREPDAFMILAGAGAFTGGPSGRDEARDCFKAMIDAALGRPLRPQLVTGD